MSSTISDVSTCFQVKPVDPTAYHWGDLSTHYIAWAISGILALAATLMSFVLILQHYRYYTIPEYQRYITRILYMVPIYATMSWLSFRFFRDELYFDVFRDCYEAFVIYSFFTLLLHYLGDGDEGVLAALKDKPVMKFPFPLRRFTYDPKNPHFLNNCRIGTLQYVVVQPLLTFISVITLELGVYCPDSLEPIYTHPYIIIVNFLSVTVAMYTLITFYFTIRTDLVEYKPILKFLSVKFVIFFSFWQSVFVSVLAYFHVVHETEYWTVDNVSSGIQNFLICIEMVIAALLHFKAFDYREYINPFDKQVDADPKAADADPKATEATGAVEATEPTPDPIPPQWYHIFQFGKAKTKWYESLMDSFNPADIYWDCHHSAKHIHRVIRRRYMKGTKKLAGVTETVATISVQTKTDAV